MNRKIRLTVLSNAKAIGLLSTIIATLLFSSIPVQAAEPLSAGQQAQSFSRQVSKTVTANYLLYLPDTYEVDKNRRWPLIIFLHGSGERGNDLSKLKVHSLPKLLDTRRDFPFIVISPQAPPDGDWDTNVLDALLDDVLEKLPIDPERVYLTGLSMGGHTTWNWAANSPERFAAIAPVAGIGPHFRSCRLLHVPVWAFHGDQDSVVPFKEDELMVKAVQSCGGEARLTAYAGGGHDAWSETYANPELYKWFLQHVRTTP